MRMPARVQGHYPIQNILGAFLYVQSPLYSKHADSSEHWFDFVLI